MAGRCPRGRCCGLSACRLYRSCRHNNDRGAHDRTQLHVLSSIAGPPATGDQSPIPAPVFNLPDIRRSMTRLEEPASFAQTRGDSMYFRNAIACGLLLASAVPAAAVPNCQGVKRGSVTVPVCCVRGSAAGCVASVAECKSRGGSQNSNGAKGCDLPASLAGAPATR